MFHRERDASKVALAALVDLLREDAAPDRLLDVQWWTPHLGSLGAVAVPRRRYLRLLERALQLPLPPAFNDGRGGGGDASTTARGGAAHRASPDPSSETAR
jgi:leucyl/phenylalanyl-tRNA--protein transferase